MHEDTKPQYIFPPHPKAAAAIKGSDKIFAVRRIFCVGRNYMAHAREMGFSEKEAPFFFTKPADAVVDSGGDSGGDSGAHIPYPPLTQDLHHEIEMVLAIGKSGSNISPEDAASHLYGAAVGIDLTRRDLQLSHREKGQPWDWGKAFDNSAPLSPITPIADLPESMKALDNGRIWLAVNGEVKQDGDLSELIWSVPDIIAFCSKSVELKSGDLIFTGTPAGVSAIKPGDVITGGIDGIASINITITKSP